MTLTFFKTLSNLQMQINIFIDEVDNVDYQYKAVRLESFKNWPITYIKPEKLAAAGFYFTGQDDKVKCFDCRLELYKWKEGDDPMMNHRSFSPTCRFICNVPYNILVDFELSTSLSKDKETQILTKEDTNASGLSNMERDWFTNKLEMAKHPYYSMYSLRLDTFQNWPTSKTQTKEQLAEAGFFYAGNHQNNDHVLCFYCGLGLGDWQNGDNPWKLHALWMPDCFYLLEIKGQEYVNSFQISEESYLRQIETQLSQDIEATSSESAIKENSGSNSGISNISSDVESMLRNMSTLSVKDNSNITKSSHTKTKSSSSIAESTEKLLCEFCYDNKRDIAFMSCMHIVACFKCSKKFEICPICRQKILYRMPVKLV
ncbi:death-associated inhibitor of apoptosis 1-like [Linepithema humile]|uniref:death-associated inhibitor of apoptosis 1-like n=1 Tax=Linepithema humile TaxID=83485 RepID=UPI0006237253|nr:PREDICTED: baculoviral IAP repeat-containing protein 3-like [Linepithema humile]